jgi:hypothetical protein
MAGKHVRLYVTAEQFEMGGRKSIAECEIKDRAGIQTAPAWGEKGTIERYRLGNVAEAAVHQYLPNSRWNTKVSRGGQDWDLEFPCGCRADVKAPKTTEQPYALRKTNLALLTCPILILTWWNNYPWTLTVVGYALKGTFLEHYETADFGYGKRYVLRSKHFQSIEHLKNPRMVHGPECSLFLKPDGIQSELPLEGQPGGVSRLLT